MRFVQQFLRSVDYALRADTCQPLSTHRFGAGAAAECVTHRAREDVIHPFKVLSAKQDVVERLHPGRHHGLVV